MYAVNDLSADTNLRVLRQQASLTGTRIHGQHKAFAVLASNRPNAYEQPALPWRGPHALSPCVRAWTTCRWSLDQLDR
jgi:hypothetical protein